MVGKSRVLIRAKRGSLTLGSVPAGYRRSFGSEEGEVEIALQLP